MYFLKYSLYSFFILLSGLASYKAESGDPVNEPLVPKKKYEVSSSEKAWVDSVYQSLTLDERIAQTMMIRAHSDKGPEHIAEVERLIKTYNVGSLCFFQGTAEKQAALTNQYQAIAKTPLIIAIDAEWGLGMRLKETTISFPKNLALGGIQDNKLIYEYGRQLGFQCKRLGIHMNFAPAVDINNNAKNPVINERSFGENRYNVSGKSYQLMMGLQDENVIACAKHFPGHGDTDVDSHLDLPSILHNRKRIDSLELYPFRVLIQHDIQSIMVAHLQIPCLDTAQNLPTTLSPKVVTQLLKDQLCYEGLIVTDALEMKGISKYFKNGEIEAKALIAGNDVLCLPGDVGAALTAIKAAIETGELPLKRIEESVKKILHAKYRLGLNDHKPIKLENIDLDLNNDEALALKRQLIEKSIVAVRNNDHILPIAQETGPIATLAIGSNAKTTFQKTVDLYRNVAHFNCPKTADSLYMSDLLLKLKDYPLVLVSLHEMSSKAVQNYNLSPNMIALIEALQRQQKIVLSIFGNPYSLRNFDTIQNVLLGWSEDPMAQSTVAQALFGAIGTDAKLPVTASAAARYGMGEKLNANQTIAYDRPENVGISSAKLLKVDSLIKDAIAQKAMPGAVVLVAKNGKIIYQKAFGNKTFDSLAIPVSTASVFDLASITKMAATTLAVMKLQEQGQLDLDAPIGNYLSSLRGSSKANLTVRELMTHHSGLTAWIPFYKKNLDRQYANSGTLAKIL
jgi:beta-N-acetylhexosaminidase